MSEAIDREGPRRQPDGPHQGSQRWHRLLFSHWEVPAERLKPLVHPELSIDTFEGRAYVGVVAFAMQNVRPWRWLPGVPGAQNFFEINVRTYVHHRGDPGVWFFSLDANNGPASFAARTFWPLPYWHAQIEGADDGRQGSWLLVRRRPTPAHWTAKFEIGEAIGEAQPGSLEFWLTERYRLFARRGDKLLRGKVHHTPYPLRRAKADCGGGMLEALGLPSTGARTADSVQRRRRCQVVEAREALTKPDACGHPSPAASRHVTREPAPNANPTPAVP
ncbi:MAG: DUF2071 domain-containing protein [Myxococcaceae bacterium]